MRSFLLSLLAFLITAPSCLAQAVTPPLFETPQSVKAGPRRFPQAMDLVEPSTMRWRVARETLDAPTRQTLSLQDSSTSAAPGWGTLTNTWTFRAPADWDASRVLGMGIDIRQIPAFERKRSIAFTPSPPPRWNPIPPLSTTPANANDSSGPVTLVADVQYLDDIDDVARLTSNTAGFGLGFGTDDFSVGLDFKTSGMKQSQSTSNRSWFIVSYSDMQITNFPFNPELTDDAQTLWLSSPDKFYNTYGTHFISSMTTGAYLKVIYTISADSQTSLSGFSNQAGLSAGIAGWNVGLKGKVAQASATYSASVRISSHVVAVGNAGLALPTVADLDFTTVEAMADTYRKKLNDTNRTGLPVLAFRLTNYAELFRGIPPGSDRAIAHAVSALREISDAIDDIYLILSYPILYPSDRSYQPLEMLSQLNNQNSLITTGLTNVLEYAPATTSGNLEQLVLNWIALRNTLNWPKTPAGPIIRWPAPTPPDASAAPTAGTPAAVQNPELFRFAIQLPAGGLAKLQSAQLFGNPKDTTAPPSGTTAPPSTPMPQPGPRNLLTSDPFDDPATHLPTYNLDPIAIDKDAATTTWIEVTDTGGRTFQFFLSTPDGKRRSELNATSGSSRMISR